MLHIFSTSSISLLIKFLYLTHNIFCAASSILLFNLCQFAPSILAIFDIVPESFHLTKSSDNI